MTDREMLKEILEKIKYIPRFDVHYDKEFGEDHRYHERGDLVNYYELQDIELFLEKHINKGQLKVNLYL